MGGTIPIGHVTTKNARLFKVRILYLYVIAGA